MRRLRKREKIILKLVLLKDQVTAWFKVVIQCEILRWVLHLVRDRAYFLQVVKLLKHLAGLDLVSMMDLAVADSRTHLTRQVFTWELPRGVSATAILVSLIQEEWCLLVKEGHRVQIRANWTEQITWLIIPHQVWPRQTGENQRTPCHLSKVENQVWIELEYFCHKSRVVVLQTAWDWNLQLTNFRQEEVCHQSHKMKMLKVVLIRSR